MSKMSKKDVQQYLDEIMKISEERIDQYAKVMFNKLSRKGANNLSYIDYCKIIRCYAFKIMKEQPESVGKLKNILLTYEFNLLDISSNEVRIRYRPYYMARDIVDLYTKRNKSKI